ncbi:hypothetical protein [Actinoplanes sp. NPDC051851]|uniref:hypothetical protein n=1 Tax=Actinoplanes sp. NPDC051851 TaxID=3154753 RepID=UPI0034168097
MHPTLRRLDEIAAHLATLDDTIAVLALGSAGAQRGRIDDHSDLNLFLVVADGAVGRYTGDADWLDAVAPVVHTYANDRHGRKALFADGILVEFAVFTQATLRTIPFRGARVVWQRPDAPRTLTESGVAEPRTPFDTVEFHLNEALVDLLVGLNRDRRGERLSASRLIQQHAVDRVIALLRLDEGEPPYRDLFDPSRRVERAYRLPLAAMVPGYDGNAAAARTILDWLSSRYPVPPALGRAIEDMLSL